MIKSAAKNCIK